MVCYFFKQKTAYEMRISDWSSDVCSSDLMLPRQHAEQIGDHVGTQVAGIVENAEYATKIMGATRPVGGKRAIAGQHRDPKGPTMPEQPDRSIHDRGESRPSPVLPPAASEQRLRSANGLVVATVQDHTKKTKSRAGGAR